MKKIITGVLLGLTCTYALGNQEKYVKYRLVANNGFVIALIALEYKNISEKEKEKVESKCFIEVRSEEAQKLFKKITGNKSKKFIYICNIDL
ncbi:TPA: hypothetical protein QEK28_004516 [Stenotrophomonas maltophilia]|nr:hypothetical protein [Stenotrophomonas maltophilia]